MSEFSAIFFGLGSIGKKHCSNYRKLFPDARILTPNNTTTSRKFIEENNVEVIDIKTDWQADIAFITNPTSLHLKTAIMAAKKGCHLFIEKPFVHEIEDCQSLKKIIIDKNLGFFVAFNYRFHPLLAHLKSLLQNNTINGICSVSIDYGQYFPDWHPYEDYRNSYVGKKELGGGTILTASHEIDYAIWIFGKPLYLNCVGGKRSSLDIDVEDVVDISMLMEGKFNLTIHLDILQKKYTRNIKIVTEQGNWEIDLVGCQIHKECNEKKELVFETTVIDKTEILEAEVKHFVSHLMSNDIAQEYWIEQFNEAIDIQKVALYAKQCLEKNNKKIGII